jgi:hypothetical protein
MAQPPDPYVELRRALEESVLSTTGSTSRATRERALGGEDVPADLASLVAKIHERAYAVTDEEMAALGDRYDDDALFEICAAAAVGAAGDRLDAALAALEGDGDAPR